MGTLAGNALIDELSRRLRDLTSTGYPRADILDIVNRTQRAINARLGLVHTSTAFSTGETPLYSVDAIATNIVRVVDVRDDDRPLQRVPWPQLVHQDSKWIRLRGTPEVWSPIGRTMIAVIPTPYITRSLTAVSIKMTSNLADAGAPLLDIPDDFKPILLDLAEAVLLVRAREYKMIEAALTRVLPALGMSVDMQNQRRGGDKAHG
jgi:hypothetical protein